MFFHIPPTGGWHSLRSILVRHFGDQCPILREEISRSMLRIPADRIELWSNDAQVLGQLVSP